MNIPPNSTSYVIELEARDVAPFALCAALGTLEVIRVGIWGRDAGIWTVGRPIFLEGLSSLDLSDEVREALTQVDEIAALPEEAANAALDRMVIALRNELRRYQQLYWRASLRGGK
jgi:hypothetical protein